MVCGTEDMLERLSGSADTFTLNTGAKDPKIILRLIKKRNFGGWYSVDVLDEHTKNNVKLPEQVWICNVTRFVFGHMPKEIRITWKERKQGGIRDKTSGNVTEKARKLRSGSYFGTTKRKPLQRYL